MESQDGLLILGEPLMARDATGRLKTRIVSVFPRGQAIVTMPGIHATQRFAYTDELNRLRSVAGEAPLSDAEQERIWCEGVDLVLENDAVLIRPDPSDMDLAFEADELLQKIISKRVIKFMHVLDPRVHEAIKQRGECWRINALPRSSDEMKRMIAASRIGIGGKEIYYYNNATGTRLLTCQEFAGLASLDDAALRQYLLEIKTHVNLINRQGNPEAAFFALDAPKDQELIQALNAIDIAHINFPDLRGGHESLQRQFYDFLTPDFRRDNPECPQWRSRMYASLISKAAEEVSEEALLGMGAEFFMQVEWLPGARIADGELIIDQVFEEDSGPIDARCQWGAPPHMGADENARGFIFNFMRDYGDLEYVNIGRVVGSLSRRQKSAGRRGVYLAEIRRSGRQQPVLRILRLQKWSVREYLDEGKDLLKAMLQSEDYTEYVLDRRLACRQLGMNLPRRFAARKIPERYDGRNADYRGRSIWTGYFEREYVEGEATDKIASNRFADREFAVAFARVLGRAAASNLIVGRCDIVTGNIMFDDGDELIVEDPRGIPVDVVVSDHTGAFVDYQSDLRQNAERYAVVVRKRAVFLPDVLGFTEAFADAFAERFMQLQNDYRKRQRGFEALFRHRARDEAGSLAYRWERVLERLGRADACELAQCIRRMV